jgi:hypothetical protein
VDKLFKTLAKLASRPEFLIAQTENNWPKIQKGSVRGKKPSPDWRMGLYFYSPIVKSTHIWRVVIHNPVLGIKAFCRHLLERLSVPDVLLLLYVT